MVLPLYKLYEIFVDFVLLVLRIDRSVKDVDWDGVKGSNFNLRFLMIIWLVLADFANFLG